ncbi:hypothetical protein ZIOFF_002306 [Zingiber officinale]|uniref:Uncharacterized protein n=1 Tax=Zingiber officinale TaxID=94328 RepID=A0A8J5IBB2_ZINOF|nr:hypothetical protein ZIOFF_002306 [Zingiber officinale]
MASIQIGFPSCLSRPTPASMGALRSALRYAAVHRRGLCGSAFAITGANQLFPSGRRSTVLAHSTRVRTGPTDAALLKEEWLDSLSFPFSERVRQVVPAAEEEAESGDRVAGWTVGIDPDGSGAVALLKPDASGYSAQVFDTPNMEVLVGKRVRKRLDARSMIQLLQTFGAPLGTKAFIEQSMPYPQDGKQIVDSLSLILFHCNKGVVEWRVHIWIMDRDFSRIRVFSCACGISHLEGPFWYPAEFLNQGRAEALLIAAYGKGLKLE